MTEDKPPLGYEPGPQSPLPVHDERLVQIRRFTMRGIEEEARVGDADHLWAHAMGELLEHIDHLQSRLDAIEGASIDFFGDD